MTNKDGIFQFSNVKSGALMELTALFKSLIFETADDYYTLEMCVSG